jgi:predicted kinase
LELDDRLRELLADGRDVVLDYGFWSRKRRDRYKQLIDEAGGRWRLIYLQAGLDELRRRLAERNRHGGANALEVTDRHFDEFLTRWDPPIGEGEEIIAPEQR